MICDRRTQECKKCGNYWFNGIYGKGSRCDQCGSLDTFFTGELEAAKDIRGSRKRANACVGCGTNECGDPNPECTHIKREKPAATYVCKKTLGY